MIRTFNYTRRKKIARSCVRIGLSDDPGAGRSFDAEIDLDELDLPGDARVYVEAYRRTAYMRFDFGTVARRTPPEDRQLTLFGTGLCFFRVKVVDLSHEIGRIIAEADGISSANLDNIPSGRVCLLHVDYRDLGESVWLLEIEHPMPILVVNNRIESIREIVRSDRRFHALVFPAIVRQVLQKILILDNFDPSEEEENWQSQWMRFARTLNPDEYPQSNTVATNQEDRLQWIEQAVQGYGEHFRVLEGYVQTESGEVR